MIFEIYSPAKRLLISFNSGICRLCFLITPFILFEFDFDSHQSIALWTFYQKSFESESIRHTELTKMTEDGVRFRRILDVEFATKRLVQTSRTLQPSMNEIWRNIVELCRLNMPHDDDFKCQRFIDTSGVHNVMSRMLDHNTYPWAWSNCSRYFITEFLECVPHLFVFLLPTIHQLGHFRCLRHGFFFRNIPDNELTKANRVDIIPLFQLNRMMRSFLGNSVTKCQLFFNKQSPTSLANNSASNFLKMPRN